MISLTAQNKYFSALEAIIKTLANNPKIDQLYDEMIAEFQNNKIGLTHEGKSLLFENLEMRFYKFSGIRIARRQLEKFSNDKIILKDYPDLSMLIEKEQNKSADVKINPLDFIDPAVLGYFLDTIEKNVCGENGKWGDSNIRLAAFCELIYEKRYFTVKPTGNKNRPINFINDFSKSRYGIDISTSLLAAKKKERESHKTRIKNKKRPLKNYFK
ncbi:MAG: hypothetical protein ACTHNG_11365 [Ginsengibacter sp.]